MKRIRGVRWLAALAALALLGSVAAQSLSFWSWRTEDVDAYNQFIAAFHQDHPDINVTFTPYKNTEYNTILSTALQGGGGPDIVHLRAYGGMEPLAEAGLLVPLGDKVPALANFDPNVLKAATDRADGKVYGVPFALRTVQVLYKKDVFAKLGLSEPTTWQDFLDVAQKIEASGIDALANGTKDPWTVETLFGGVAPASWAGPGGAGSAGAPAARARGRCADGVPGGGCGHARGSAGGAFPRRRAGVDARAPGWRGAGGIRGTDGPRGGGQGSGAGLRV